MLKVEGNPSMNLVFSLARGCGTQVSLALCCVIAVLLLTGARSAVCEVPFDYIASETQGGLGGTCVLRGCVPKKLLSYGGEFVNDFKAAEGYGCNSAATSCFEWLTGAPV